MDRRRFLKTAAGLFIPAAPALILPSRASAQMSGGAIFPGPGVKAYGSAAVTLNPSDKGANITLSGGNLTATNTTTRNAVRSTTSKSSGKFYFEIAFSSVGGGGGGFDHCIGIANASASLTNAPAPGGNDKNSIAKYMGSANVQLNNTTVGSSNTSGPPATVCVAVDFSGSVIWFRIGSGNWNNNAANDPATNTGGISFSTINAGPFFAIVALEPNGGTTSAAGTINFGATAFSFTAPSGFGNW